MARARSGPKNLIEKLADAGEDALARVSDAPVLGRVVETAGGVKERLDELTLKVRGLEGIERRVQELERRLDELSRAAKPAPARPSAAKRPTAAKAKAAPAKKPVARAKKPGPVPGP